ncbi:MAG: DUF3180 domain-containing protein [Nocardioidaceae bacterium]|nr:DUF3180 domain-containing protein [Nocardioidaceae bacterium]
MSDDDERRLRPTSAPTLAVSAIVGLFCGGLVRPVVESGGGVAPPVGLTSALALVFLSALLFTLAWGTHRRLHTQLRSLDWNHAVNLLVLGKATALVGALVAGGYLGYAYSFAPSWDSPLGRDRVIHSLLAAVAAALVMVAGVALERACRVPGDDDDDDVLSRPDASNGQRGGPPDDPEPRGARGSCGARDAGGGVAPSDRHV